jgi:hypothetical protein
MEMQARHEAIQNASRAPTAEMVRNLSERSELFDACFYLSSYRDRLGGIAPLQHFAEHGHTGMFDPNPLFDSRHYLELYCRASDKPINPLYHYLTTANPDERWVNPFFHGNTYIGLNDDVRPGDRPALWHYLHHGLKEARRSWHIERALELLETKSQNPLATNCFQYFLSGERRPQNRKRRIAVYSSSMGNYFFDEIKLVVVEGFRNVGWTVYDLTDRDERPGDVDLDLVVAPHEFFYLGDGPKWIERIAYRPTTIIYNCEQLHREWFGRSFPFLRGASTVLDINLQSAAVLRRLGINAHYFPVGFLPELSPFSTPVTMPRILATGSLPKTIFSQAVSPALPMSERPLDVFFCGYLAPRREAFLAGKGKQFAAWRCFFHLIREPAMPIVAGSRCSLNSEAAIALSRLSKILLNIHQDETPYFEWHRIVMQGIWQGTLVVTEPSFEIPFLSAGTHYISCERDEIPARIHWLLETEEGRQVGQQVACAGFAQLRRCYDHIAITQSLIDNALPV